MADLIVTVVAVAIVLGADAFSLSLGMGIKGVRKSYEIKFASTVGVFHVIMPLTGLYLGLAAGKFLGIWAGRLGAVVLAYIALDMLRKAYSHSRMKSTSFKDGRKLLAGEGIPPRMTGLSLSCLLCL
jgi:putative Mn2+ efflux pump MntP